MLNEMKLLVFCVFCTSVMYKTEPKIYKEIYHHTDLNNQYLRMKILDITLKVSICLLCFN